MNSKTLITVGILAILGFVVYKQYHKGKTEKMASLPLSSEVSTEE